MDISNTIYHVEDLRNASVIALEEETGLLSVMDGEGNILQIDRQGRKAFTDRLEEKTLALLLTLGNTEH